MLPQLDQQPLFNAVNSSRSIYNSPNTTIFATGVKTLWCPSDPTIDQPVTYDLPQTNQNQIYSPATSAAPGPGTTTAAILCGRREQRPVLGRQLGTPNRCHGRTNNWYVLACALACAPRSRRPSPMRRPPLPPYGGRSRPVSAMPTCSVPILVSSPCGPGLTSRSSMRYARDQEDVRSHGPGDASWPGGHRWTTSSPRCGRCATGTPRPR